MSVQQCQIKVTRETRLCRAWHEVMSSEPRPTGAEGDDGAERGVGQGFANGGHPEPHCSGGWRETIATCSLAILCRITVHVALIASVCGIAIQATAVLRTPFTGQCGPFEGGCWKRCVVLLYCATCR